MAHFPLAKRRAFLYKVFRRAEVAQLVEQGTENPRVGSSILSLGTTQNKKGLRLNGRNPYWLKESLPAKLGGFLLTTKHLRLNAFGRKKADWKDELFYALILGTTPTSGALKLVFFLQCPQNRECPISISES